MCVWGTWMLYTDNLKYVMYLFKCFTGYKHFHFILLVYTIL